MPVGPSLVLGMTPSLDAGRSSLVLGMTPSLDAGSFFMQVSSKMHR